MKYTEKRGAGRRGEGERARGRGGRRRARGPSAEAFVEKCLAEVGDAYEWGGEYAPGTPPSETREWDCSGLVYTKLLELGIDDVPRTSGQMDAWAIRVDYETGKRTLGALMLMDGHVGVSLGDGRTVEASGSKGVAVLPVTFQAYTHAGLVPGLRYPGRAPGRADEEQDDDEAPDAPFDEPLLRRGSSGEAVRRLQAELAAAGHDPGPIDGVFGAGTERAVEAFQREAGLTADGVVGPRTWDALLS